MHNCLMEKILADGKHEGMVELRKVFDKAMYKLKEVDDLCTPISEVQNFPIFCNHKSASIN